MKHNTTYDLREKTVLYWANFVHARGDIDVARVHAFQTMVRERDLTTLTDDEVTEAYGGRGWAPAPSCWECGVREDTNVTFGVSASNGEMFSLCVKCIDAAKAMNTIEPPVQKQSFFSRFKRG